LEIHLEQGLLHVQYVRAAVLDELRPVTQQGAQSDQVGFHPKRICQQAIAVQSLDPLAIEHVRLAAGKPLDRSGADEATLEAACFQYLEQRNPVDAGGFHRHRFDAVLPQPVGQGVQVSGVSAEGAHELGVVRPRHADHDLVRTYVYASGVEVHPRQSFKWAAFRARMSMTFAELAHTGIS
jgi:hypothetical protein